MTWNERDEGWVILSPGRVFLGRSWGGVVGWYQNSYFGLQRHANGLPGLLERTLRFSMRFLGETVVCHPGMFGLEFAVLPPIFPLILAHLASLGLRLGYRYGFSSRLQDSRMVCPEDAKIFLPRHPHFNHGTTLPALSTSLR